MIDKIAVLCAEYFLFSKLFYLHCIFLGTEMSQSFFPVYTLFDCLS